MADGKVKIQIETNAEKASYDMKKLDKSLQDVKKSGQATVSQNSVLESSMSSLKTAATRLVGAYLGLQGIKAVTSYVMSANEAFKVQERAILSLNNALMNSGSYTYEYSQHLQQLASEIQSYSNYGDEATEKAIALGQAFMGNVRMTDDLIKATVDFAAATGKDLDSAFTLVGKSIGSSTNALGRYGIELGKGIDDSQKMQAIIEQLGNRYEGSAQKMADSTTQLKNAMGDLSEAIGKIFNPAIVSAEKTLIKWANSAINSINRVRVGMSEVSNLNEITDLEKKISMLQKTQAKYNESLKTTKSLSMQGYIRQELKKMSAQEAEAKSKLNSLRKAEQTNAIQSQAKGYKMRDDDFVTPVSSSRSSRGSSSKSTPAVKQALDAYEQLQQKAQEARRQVELMAIKFGSSSAEVQTAYANYKQFNEQLTQISDIFKEEASSGAYEELQNKINKLADSLRNLAAGGDTSSANFAGLKEQYNEAVEQMKQVNDSLTTKMGMDWDEIGKNAKHSLITGIVSSLKEGENAWESFGNVAVRILEDIAVKMLENIELEQVMNGIKAVGKTIGSLFMFAEHGMAIENGVKKFARGGVVNQPTIFPMKSGTGLMGEAGAEAIMPLRRTSNGDLGVKATTPTINIYNQSGSQIETRKGTNGDINMFIKEVNNALANEKTQAGFSRALQRNNSRGVQAS